MPAPSIISSLGLACLLAIVGLALVLLFKIIEAIVAALFEGRGIFAGPHKTRGLRPGGGKHGGRNEER